MLVEYHPCEARPTSKLGGLLTFFLHHDKIIWMLFIDPVFPWWCYHTPQQFSNLSAPANLNYD